MNSASPDRKLNVLLVGAGMYVCGRTTDSYGTVLPTLYQVKKTHGIIGRVAICATSRKSILHIKKKNAQLQKMFGVSLDVEFWPKKGKTTTSYKDAIKDSGTSFDCALIVVPDYKHHQIAKDVMTAGIHTLIVKPFVPTVSQAIKLVELMKKKKLYGAVEFHKRYDYANIKLRDDLRSGKLGDPLYFHVEYSQRKCIPENIFSHWVDTTNIFQYLGVHYVDLIYFLTGAIPIRVLALGQKTWLKGKGISTYDSIEVMIEWKQGRHSFASTHLTNWIDPNTTTAMSDQKIKVVATRGRFESDQKHRGVQIVTDKDGVEDFNPYFSQMYSGHDDERVFAGYGYEGFCTFFKDVHAIVSGERAWDSFNGFRPTFQSSIISTAVIEAANMSLKQKNVWIKTDYRVLKYYTRRIK